ncbi:MAG: response regulator [Flavobacterium sp.]|jgi:DNA-binding NarL/FixJ family response regulator|nr:response regulator [Flavobacterium sp.]
MFKKVLIAEDFDSINIAIVQVLKGIGITTIDYAKYCDDAYTKLKKADKISEPFDLLITDLSFVEDHRKVKLTSGEALIEKVREKYPDLKILVYSVEDKVATIAPLFEKHNINAFVQKGRHSISQLKTALATMHINQKFISPEVAHAMQESTTKEIDEFDIYLLQQLSQGKGIDEVEIALKIANMKPNSKSAIEKRIFKLKDYFKANNSLHLIAITKDLGII